VGITGLDKHTKAADRFFGNERISEGNILAGHFEATRQRFAGSGESVALILHDTTELSYMYEDAEADRNPGKDPPLARPEGQDALIYIPAVAS
jgi:hypothetical protein